MDNVHQSCQTYDETQTRVDNMSSKNMSSDFFGALSSIPNKRGFKMGFLNIVSLLKKIDEINFSMTNKFIDLIAFNETRLDPNITDNMVSLDGYDVIRKDRSRNGGGVCIFSRSFINYKIRKDLVPPELEAVCVEIIKPHSKPFLVTTVYNHPVHYQNFLMILKIDQSF